VFEFLGVLVASSARDLSGSWQSDWVGSWDLDRNDDFAVANFSNGPLRRRTLWLPLPAGDGWGEGKRDQPLPRTQVRQASSVN
jgi:hypothetical protein